MSWTLADVDAAERRIRAECPGAKLHRSDFDFGLSVELPDGSGALIVFDAAKIGPTTVVADVVSDAIARWWKAWKPSPMSD